MASNYLGPERPQPFALISESYQNDLDIPDYPEEDQYRFGNVYEEAIFNLIHTHLELGTTDRFCYVGESKGSFDKLISKKFCLINDTKSLSPGIKSHSSKTDLVPITYGIPCSEADDFFKNAYSQCTTYKRNLFDRIMLKDCINFVSGNLLHLFTHMKACLHPEGRLVIIHRPGMLNTLPLPKYVLQRLESQSFDIAPILNALQDAGFDVKWDIEMCPIVMPKVKWLSMIQHKYPTDLEVFDDLALANAIRELTEGMLKYEGDLVQFTDRLLFISASPSLREMTPTVVRYGSHGYKASPVAAEEDLSYRMPVTTEIKRILDSKSQTKRPNIGRTTAKWN